MRKGITTHSIIQLNCEAFSKCDLYGYDRKFCNNFVSKGKLNKSAGVNEFNIAREKKRLNYIRVTVKENCGSVLYSLVNTNSGNGFSDKSFRVYQNYFASPKIPSATVQNNLSPAKFATAYLENDKAETVRKPY